MQRPPSLFIWFLALGSALGLLLGGCGAPLRLDPPASPVLPPEPEVVEAPVRAPLSREELDVRYRLALALNEEAEWDAALRHLELLAHDWPTHWVVHLERARALYRTNQDEDEVRGALEKSIELNPQNPRSLVMLGQLSEDREDFVDAERMYRRAIAIRADELSPRLALARLLRHGERHEEAVDVLKEAARDSRGNIRVLTQLAGALEDAGHLKDARLSFERIAESHPDKLRGLTLLYRYLARHNEVQDANALAERINTLKRESGDVRELRPLRPSPK